ncbi:RusA family crossover junction endodeoxyribonuclease [Actinomadura sp. 3N508]|uniref:RusA family crossover junction endodeoxyribonuclease n=1 Tax=Actinomadura sp. 3N508 TaxID=3375153 RepID=UPI0037A6A3A6
MTVTVTGTPAGQGNLSAGRHGKLYHSNSAELKTWRTLIQVAAVRVSGYHPLTLFGARKTCMRCGKRAAEHGLFSGPVALDAVVALARPPSVTRPYPTSRHHSDWDHHARALGDALTGVLYADDSQIVDGHVRQVYVDGPGCPLPRPGARITVSEMPR